LRIGYLQFAPVFGNKELNLQRVEDYLRGAKADLVVLPELFATGYLFESRQELLDLAEDTTGPTFTALRAMSQELGVSIVAGIAERAGDDCYNSIFVFGYGEIAASYRKVHLFDREKQLFSPGDTPFPVFDHRGAKIGLMICFDWIFPEATRVLALKGAQVVCHPSNLVLPYCPAAMITRCIENGFFAVTVNRVGVEARAGVELKFIGTSQIVNPRGVVLMRSGEVEEGLRIIDIDPRQADDKMVTARNHLIRDRRPGFYKDLCDVDT